jgi:hypothetical protein
MAHPGLVRAALEADEDLPDGPDSKGVIHLVAAIGLGAEEVGSDALAEAMGSFGMFGLSVEDWAQMLEASERGEAPPMDWEMFQQRADVLSQVQCASDEQLLRARTVSIGLRSFYGLYVLHGLFMPDTPALAALRQRIDDWGVFPVLDQMISLSPSPRQFAESLTGCLEPFLDRLYEALMEQLAADPGIFRIPGDDSGPVGFGETWIRTLREKTKATGGQFGTEGAGLRDVRTRRR